MLTDEDIAALGERGWFVRDGFLSADAVDRAIAASERLRGAGAFHAAGVRRGADHRVEKAVRGDEIAWIDEGAPDPFPELRERFLALKEELNASAYLGLSRMEVQLAHYPGEGEGYAAHRDAFAGPGNRRLTAIVYLNRGWVPEHGGALRLHVDPPRDVEPQAGRLVVFLAERIQHEVLPTHAPRWALTAWFRGP